MPTYHFINEADGEVLKEVKSAKPLTDAQIGGYIGKCEMETGAYVLWEEVTNKPKEKRKSKVYVIAPYGMYQAMYEINDFRLAKMHPADVHGGTFKRDKSVIGWQNGHEIGLFHADNDKKYVIFSDNTAKEWEEK
jgi:hypothetical protein